MDCLVRVRTGPTGEVMLPEQALDTVDAFWVPQSVTHLTLSVGIYTNEVVCEYAQRRGAETRLFDGVLHRKWTPLTPNLPLFAITRQAVFLRGDPEVSVWLEGATPSPSTFVTRTILNVRVGGGGRSLLHQCRPMHIEDATRDIVDTDRKLIVSHGFAYVR